MINKYSRNNTAFYTASIFHRTTDGRFIQTINYSRRFRSTKKKNSLGNKFFLFILFIPSMAHRI